MSDYNKILVVKKLKSFVVTNFNPKMEAGSFFRKIDSTGYFRAKQTPLSRISMNTEPH
jgi:hypothetical protein